MLIRKLKSFFAPPKEKKKGEHKLYKDFMLWQMHGIADDVFIRPEYTPYIAYVQARLGSQATKEEILTLLEEVLSLLEG